jgi:hypothetical protein
MANASMTAQAIQATSTKAVKAPKIQPRLCDKIKLQLNSAVLRGGKVTAEELVDLEKHVQKVASLLT